MSAKLLIAKRVGLDEAVIADPDASLKTYLRS
jgi:hypothetical protein